MLRAFIMSRLDNLRVSIQENLDDPLENQEQLLEQAYPLPIPPAALNLSASSRLCQFSVGSTSSRRRSLSFRSSTSTCSDFNSAQQPLPQVCTWTLPTLTPVKHRKGSSTSRERSHVAHLHHRFLGFVFSRLSPRLCRLQVALLARV